MLQRSHLQSYLLRCQMDPCLILKIFLNFYFKRGDLGIKWIPPGYAPMTTPAEKEIIKLDNFATSDPHLCISDSTGPNNLRLDISLIMGHQEGGIA